MNLSQPGRSFTADYSEENGKEPLFRCRVELIKFRDWCAFLYDLRTRDAKGKPKLIYEELTVSSPKHGRELLTKQLATIVRGEGLPNRSLTWAAFSPSSLE
jgi:hypothetical protein